MVPGTDREALSGRCSKSLRSIAGRYGALETSSILELGSSSPTVPRQRTRAWQRVGRRTEAASSPHARVPCPGHGKGLPGEGGSRARLPLEPQGGAMRAVPVLPLQLRQERARSRHRPSPVLWKTGCGANRLSGVDRGKGRKALPIGTGERQRSVSGLLKTALLQYIVGFSAMLPREEYHVAYPFMYPVGH